MKQKAESKMKTRKKSHYNPDTVGVIYQFLALLMGAYGFVFALVEGIDLHYNKKIVALFLFISVCIYFVVFLLYRYLNYTIPIICIMLGIVIWRYRFFLLDGFCHAENSVIRIMNQYFQVGFLRFVTEYDEIQAVTFLIVILMQFIIIVFATVVFLGRLKWLLYLVLTLSLGFIFIIGEVPPAIPLFLLVSFIFLNVCAEFVPVQERLKSKNGKPDRRSRMAVQRRKICVGIVPALLVLALLPIIMLFYPATKHENYKDVRDEAEFAIRTGIDTINFAGMWENASDRFKDIFFSDEKRIFNISKGSDIAYGGGLSGGALGKAGEVRFTNETALKLTIPSNTESLYLKGYVGSIYTGDSWDMLPEEAELIYQEILDLYGNGKYSGITQVEDFIDLIIMNTVELLDSYTISSSEAAMLYDLLTPLTKHSMTIDYYNANSNYAYLPYILASINEEDVLQLSDGYYVPDKENVAYTIEYYDMSLHGMRFVANKIMDGIVRNERIINDVYDFDNYFAYGILWIIDEEGYLDYLDFAQAYNAFVYDQYTRIPDGLDRLEVLAHDLKKPAVKDNPFDYFDNEYIISDIFDSVDSVRDYLVSNTSYSLAPGKLPSGADYAEYFLFDNQIGYCAHYATSAVLLLRSMGIPARYVEGYIVTKEDVDHGMRGGDERWDAYPLYKGIPNNQFQVASGSEEMVTVEIRDTNAHAWVEVYVSGFGWIPVEVTSGYAADGRNHSYNSSIKDQIANLPEPTRLPTNTPTPIHTPTPTPVPTSIETPTPTSPLDKFPEKDDNNKGTNKEGDSDSKNIGEKIKDWYSNAALIVRLLLAVLVVLLALLLLITLRYQILKKRLNTKLNAHRLGKRVLWIYYEIERIFKRSHITKLSEMSYLDFAKELSESGRAKEDFEDVMGIILKARFSDESVLEDECQRVYETYAFFRKCLYSRYEIKGRLGYIWLKYIVVI